MKNNNQQKNVALVTGANRGLGLGCVNDLLGRGYHVIATARHLDKLISVAKKEDWAADQIDLLELDVGSEQSLANFEKQLARFPKIDILINNAGVYLDSRDSKAFATPGKEFMRTLETNVYGPYRLIQMVSPLMLKNKFGRIVNVSSGMGQLSEMGSAFETYRISKTAINGLTAVAAADFANTNVLVNSVCPGWVQTDMGGAGATRKLPEGVASILWAAFIPDGGPNGGFFRDGKPLPW